MAPRQWHLARKIPNRPCYHLAIINYGCDTRSCARAVNARAPKTDGGWRLEGRPGAWKWIAPATPPSAQQMARARKVAVAKGKAFVSKDRNRPRQT